MNFKTSAAVEAEQTGRQSDLIGEGYALEKANLLVKQVSLSEATKTFWKIQ